MDVAVDLDVPAVVEAIGCRLKNLYAGLLGELAHAGLVGATRRRGQVRFRLAWLRWAESPTPPYYALRLRRSLRLSALSSVPIFATLVSSSPLRRTISSTRFPTSVNLTRLIRWWSSSIALPS